MTLGIAENYFPINVYLINKSHSSLSKLGNCFLMSTERRIREYEQEYPIAVEKQTGPIIRADNKAEELILMAQQVHGAPGIYPSNPLPLLDGLVPKEWDTHPPKIKNSVYFRFSPCYTKLTFKLTLSCSKPYKKHLLMKILFVLQFPTIHLVSFI